MTTLAAPSAPRSLVFAVLAFGVPLAAGFLGSLATMPALAPWYAGLEKPWFNPPNWLFGPAWTTLYLLMGYAFWRVLRAPVSPARTAAIAVFLAHMAVNAAWSFAFFGLRSPATGLLVAVALVLAVILTIGAFARIDRLAAWLHAPVLAWVSFALVLNAAIWRLNG